MNILSLDGFIVAAFLLITLVVGLRAGRGVKDIREYALGSKHINLGVLTMSFLATYIGGHNITALPASVFAYGIIQAITIGTFVSLLLGAILLPPILVRYKDCMTLGEVFHSSYKARSAQVISGLIGLIFSVLMVGGQIWGLGYVGSTVFGLDPETVLWTVGLSLVLYTAAGGVRSVAFTDVLQFMALTLVVSLMANKLCQEVGGVKMLFFKVHQAYPKHLQFFNHPYFYKKMASSLLWGFFPVVLLYPPILQRLLMVDTPAQARNMLINSSLFYMVFRVMIMIIGLGALLLHPEIKPGNFTPFLIKEVFSQGMQGILVCGVLAVMMSTADSFLNTAGIIAVRDIIRPLSATFSTKHSFFVCEVRLMQLLTLVIGVLAIMTAQKSAHTHQMLFYSRVTLSSLIIPFFGSIFSTKNNVTLLVGSLMGFVVGTVAAIYSSDSPLYFYSSKNKDAIALCGLLGSGIAFISLKLASYRGRTL